MTDYLLLDFLIIGVFATPFAWFWTYKNIEHAYINNLHFVDQVVARPIRYVGIWVTLFTFMSVWSITYWNSEAYLDCNLPPEFKVGGECDNPEYMFFGGMIALIVAGIYYQVIGNLAFWLGEKVGKKKRLIENQA